MSDETHKYEVTVNWKHDTVGQLAIAGKPDIQVASPPEFDGPAGIISPEDMFVSSATTCFMTTFVAFSNKMRFDFESFSCKGEGTLERVEKGFEFTKIVLETTVEVGSSDLKKKAERALELAGKYCLVSNSMKCETEHINKVEVA